MTRDSFNAIKTPFVDIADLATFKKEIGFALMVFNSNAYINKSTTKSKLNAVLQVAQCGLSLHPALKLAYLVPRWNNSTQAIECHLEPSYQGLVKLITDTGSARNVYCYPVYEGDTFSVSLGTSPDIVHTPQFKSKEIIKVYAVAVLSDGSNQIEVMTTEQINEIKGRSESYKSFIAKKSKSCIWESDYSEMARKTVVKRLCKYLPKTDMWDKLGQAIDLSNMDYGATYEQKEYIETLLMTANIPTEEYQQLYKEVSIMTSERAAEVIKMLKENQVDPISAGHSYGQTEIKEKIKHEIE